MPIDDIVAEKAQQGELNANLAREMGLASSSQTQGQQARPTRPQMTGSMPTQIQVPAEDAEFWVEVAILAVLIGIYLKL